MTHAESGAFDWRWQRMNKGDRPGEHFERAMHRKRDRVERAMAMREMRNTPFGGGPMPPFGGGVAAAVGESAAAMSAPHSCSPSPRSRVTATS